MAVWVMTVLLSNAAKVVRDFSFAYLKSEGKRRSPHSLCLLAWKVRYLS